MVFKELGKNSINLFCKNFVTFLKHWRIVSWKDLQFMHLIAILAEK